MFFMKIAIVQSEIIFESKAKNLQKADFFLKSAKEQNAQLVCFPEMSFTGFSMDIIKTAEHDFQTLKRMATLCAKYHIIAAFGWVKATKTHLAENHYTVLNEQGQIISDYIKIHPFSYGNEEKFFRGGTALDFFSCDGMTVSTFICYDLRFPEIFQTASKKATLILVAANWPFIRELHWKTLLQARAIETQSIVAGINCVGQQGNMDCKGGSVVFHANGEVLCCLDDKEHLAVLDLPDDTTLIRQKFNVHSDRREDLYVQLNKV